MSSIQVHDGRPTDRRSDVETAVYDLLDDLGIPYQRVDHPPAATIEDCAEVDEALGITLCKNLFLCDAAGTQFFLLMMPGGKRFKTKDVSRQIGASRLSFADADHMMQYLRITPGAVSVMGLMNDAERRVRLLMDKDLLEDAYIGCHPCVNTVSLKIETGQLVRKFLVHVGHAPTYVTL
ncbi:MAG: prolyl-tRNA synthetase associated domain-containing protein [Christensenellales bacterium]|jgi:Ala-tRNA(Pro) deacylase